MVAEAVGTGMPPKRSCPGAAAPCEDAGDETALLQSKVTTAIKFTHGEAWGDGQKNKKDKKKSKQHHWRKLATEWAHEYFSLVHAFLGPGSSRAPFFPGKTQTDVKQKVVEWNEVRGVYDPEDLESWLNAGPRIRQNYWFQRFRQENGQQPLPKVGAQILSGAMGMKLLVMNMIDDSPDLEDLANDHVKTNPYSDETDLIGVTIVTADQPKLDLNLGSYRLIPADKDQMKGAVTSESFKGNAGGGAHRQFGIPEVKGSNSRSQPRWAALRQRLKPNNDHLGWKVVTN
eukprot:gnl/TRDRNA2_/TRDRNA2_128053_c0_seq1.p1 gnl/TRDRNA2_/TRDRNA2_128053_c0~~gnl/TRDRNA2_/TRDRNA2_128053_c0_seq1.p1  ORF type:complete len:320 (+),score=32.46 gnl/TRDRNA2_/TRDRNA2_128053_c0_seq1:100-960(+)